MKTLHEVCPDPEKVLELKPEELGHHVLHCLSEHSEPNVSREILAKHLASAYHEDFEHKIIHAIENAIIWLLGEALLGSTANDPTLLYLTQPGKQAAEKYRAKYSV